MSRARSKARQAVVQALYQKQLAEQTLQELDEHFTEQHVANRSSKKLDREYFTQLLQGISEEQECLEEILVPLLDRPLEQVDPVERATLLLGAYELHSRLEIPYRVVLNESIELAKKYGGEDGHHYVNGVLDKLAKQLRESEIW